MSNNNRPSWADINIPGYTGMKPELELGGDSDLMVAIAASRLLAAGGTVMVEDGSLVSIPDEEFFSLVERICNVDIPVSKCEKLYAIRPVAERCGLFAIQKLSDAELVDQMIAMMDERMRDLEEELDSILKSTPLYSDHETLTAVFEQECNTCGMHLLSRYHAVRSEMTLPSGTVIPFFVPAEESEEMLFFSGTCCEDHEPLEDSIEEWLLNVNGSLINELRNFKKVQISDSDFIAFMRDIL